jgi:hypothetical protein
MSNPNRYNTLFTLKNCHFPCRNMFHGKKFNVKGMVLVCILFLHFVSPATLRLNKIGVQL